ncbi:MAG: type II secretion system F family protein [Candidatus Nanohaloarchaea archaeon]
MLERYANFCYDQMGNYGLELVEYFENLRPQLSKADIHVSLPEYLSMMIFTTLMTAVFSLFVFGALFMFLYGLTGIILGLVATFVVPTIAFMIVFLYPSIKQKQRASVIRDTLPFATMYMSTLAGTGTPVSQLFKNMSEVEEYGEVSKEAEKISRDIETFGMDISEALERAAERTPSDHYKDLMWGMNHALTSGGSMRDFLRERSETLMKDYQRRIESYSETLSLLVEMYITVVIVGSIVFTSMSAVMSSFTAISAEKIVLIQISAIFFGLPIISGMFILLVNGISPGGIR